jgi:dTDP-4-amino-4,6-dideoxygalactose transaminase
MADLRRQTAALRPELMAAMERVLDSGRYVLGDEVEAFEDDASRYLGVQHTVGVASGADALLLALRALDVGPGQAVVTTPFTFFATASAILNAGAQPVFADIDPRTFNIDADHVRTILDGNSLVHQRLGIDPDGIRAIVPVHLFGQSADMEGLAEVAESRELGIVEDAAQALGAEYRGRKVGTLGVLGCFSFFPTKNLGALGDGGLVASDDGERTARVRLLRVQGARPKYHHHLVGMNSRLDAIQAALLRAKLPRLDSWIAARQAHAELYRRELDPIEGLESPQVGPHCTHTYHQYTLRVTGGRRDELRAFLAERGVQTAVYYPVALHLQPALKRLGYSPGDFTNAERASAEALSLPVFPELREDERDHVVRAIRSFFGPRD